MTKINIQMSSKCHEESGYGLELDLLTILYQSHVSYPTRSGVVVGKNNHLRPTIYLDTRTP